jgi:cell division septum initiation protein DivIVA
VVRSGSGGGAGDVSRGQGPGVPNVRGDLGELLDHRPVFRVRLQGYDRLEVDNYTTWIEGELVAVRRQVDHLLSRFGECSAELEISRRLLAHAPRGRESFPVSERVEEILRLASDEAAAITDAGAREAEQIVAEARAEADARLRKAHEIKQMAVDAADELLEQARRDREVAAAEIDRAKAGAAEILRRAAEERDRLAEEAARERRQAAADAAEHLADARTEADDLCRQREQARQALRGLTDRIGEALQAVAAMPEGLPSHRAESNGTAAGAGARNGEPVLGAVPDVTRDNVAVEGMNRDGRDEPDVVVMAGGPTPLPR